MKNNLEYQKRISITAVALLLVFCSFVSFYERYAHQAAQSRIDEHGRIIADALWNANPKGASEYLSLACKSQNYQYIRVTDIQEIVFQKAMGDPPDWSERVLMAVHLLPEYHLASAVIHEGRPIGKIEAIWECDTVYVEGGVLFSLVMLYAIFQLTFHLLHSKKQLEDRVSERTTQLSALNASLRLEVEEHRQAREALYKSEEMYRLIAENVADVIWGMDMNFQFTYVSPSVHKQRGYTVKEAMESSLDDFIPPDELKKILIYYDEKLAHIRAGSPEAWEPTIFEIEQYCKDKSSVWTSNHVTVLRGADNKPEGLLGVTRDISQQKRAEQEKSIAERHAAEQEKHALVGQIAGKIAHDFNNILSVIMGNTELSILDCKDAAIKKTLELIYGQTVRGKNLTKNLVAFAKDQEPKQDFFRINEKIDLVLNLLKKDLEGIELKMEKGDDMPDLLADPGMIEHALVNLIQNAIHALGMVEHPRIMIRTSFSQGEICFEIEDNGCGIPKEYLDRIYDPSFTLKGNRDVTQSYKPDIKGTGYGMANIKKYIEQHKGIIQVASQFGAGTKFTICLPVIGKELTREEKIHILGSAHQSEKKILHVEDEQAISDVQCRILTQEPCNHKVDTAHTGQDAMVLFDRNAYDFVSLDYVLPGSINGMDVYHHIRQTNKTIPILFVSGNIEFLESIKELKQQDAHIDHLSKPCQNKEYVNSINGLLGKQPTAPPVRF